MCSKKHCVRTLEKLTRDTLGKVEYYLVRIGILILTFIGLAKLIGAELSSLFH